MRSRGETEILISLSSATDDHRPMDVGPGELLVILVIVVVFVGADRVPRLARSLGEAIREFNRAATDDAPNRHED